MRLVIAEKKSVAAAIAHALSGAADQGDGWFDCGQLLVTWAQGHLVELAMPEDYTNRDWGRWRLDALPIDPSGDWRWMVSGERGAAARYRSIVSLLRRSDVDCVVNACDPDREGEAIFRRIVDMSGTRKSELRLWVASLEADAIREAWESMRPESDYRGLAWSAEIRSKADWLIGMNASRAYSLLYDGRFSVGRVQTPTLAMIVDRDRRIAVHKPVPFWTVTADMGGWRLSSERIDHEAEASELRELAARNPFRILSVERRKVSDRPPCLYDLTGLQKDMSRMHGMTAARTLAALQHLYELRLATYPRTDSKYITHDDLPTLAGLIESGRLVRGFVAGGALPSLPRPELAVNDAKVAGHTAILPTMQLDASRMEALGDDERMVIMRVVRRMWEAVGDDHVHLVTEVKARLDGGGAHGFSSRSDETISPGWRLIEGSVTTETDDGEEEKEQPRNVIPSNLVDGIDVRPVGPVKVEEGMTRPPKPFTEATLLAAMEHASRYVDDRELKTALDDDESHSGGIGTPATRADTIEKLVRSRLVERKGRQLHATREGMRLIDVVEPRLKDVGLTARMEQTLTDVEHGRRDPTDVMELFRREALRIPADAKTHLKKDAVGPAAAGEDWGPCPRCGEPVRKTGRMWQCSTNRSEKTADGTWRTVGGCGWRMYPTMAGKAITDRTVRSLLEGRTVSLKGFTSKSGRKFDARIRIDKDKGTVFVFDR
ncbi:topoisomerase III [Bifidobacterium saguini DSM 23967]|uniref:DNA topoisomerase n=2 Tax=Bifidobacterium saguini TaxID=762210 RepID=A0A087D5Q0_9BIFI|nr:type IA DNA topoisomerase [Bifidobacterium saguini]KFI90850.1 topoisomerase III [Bifidobacterium saguini DSM 23967]QTB90735.1 topoisomerase C-terminal repeat-containing protein [Bifidobacterium saguini]